MATLLERLRPALTAQKTIDWPGPVPADVDRPQITLHVLNGPKREDAYLAARQHFKRRKVTVTADDPIFVIRERAEMVWRAVRDAAGMPIAVSTDQLEEELSPEVRNVLFDEWLSLQAEHSISGQITDLQLRDMVEELKKNFLEARLSVFPSSWLVRLLRTSVAQLSTLETASSSGS